MTPLDDLISRLVAATAGSRELDYAIWAIGDPVQFDRCMGANLSPCYTTSLDAAMTLVPEGWRFIRLERMRDSIFSAEIESYDGMESWYGNHHNMRLALCIACLRTIAASRVQSLSERHA